MAQAKDRPLPDFDSLWNFDRPAETEQKFRALLPLAEKSQDTAYFAELMTQIARTLGLQQKFDEAEQLLDSVQKLLPEVGARANVRYLLERGRVFNSSKQQPKAMPLFIRAWEESNKFGFDPFAVDAAHMCGIAAPPEERQGWDLKALARAEQSSDPKARRWLGSLYNNMGWAYFDAKKYDSALEVFDKALKCRIDQKQPREIRIAQWAVAKTLRYLGKVDSALMIQRSLEKDWEASGEEQDGYVFEEIGECLLSLNRATEAVPYFARAYEFLSKDPWLSRDEPERLARMKTLGQIH